MNILKWIVNNAIWLYTQITCRIDAPNLQKVPMQGPLILIVNHTGQIEAPLFMAHLQGRQITAWAKVESWDNWFLHVIFNIWGIIPVHRGAVDTSALKKALRALEEKYIFGLAPEGTRNRTGILRRALPGAVMVALHSGAPILPVAHWGGEKFIHNLKRFKRTDFHIRIGETFKIKTDGAKVTAEMRQQIVDEMMCEVAKMLPEEYRGEYSDISKSPQYLIPFE